MSGNTGHPHRNLDVILKFEQPNSPGIIFLETSFVLKGNQLLERCFDAILEKVEANMIQIKRN